MKQLAIIIPAYKVTFFRKAVASIAAQTCKDFTLYVGNDNSSDEIGEICKEYSDTIDIRYHKFAENLGGKDLVAQWERCIDLSEGEPWIWLFSDDDMMTPNCVEEFYKEIGNGDEYDIYHFNVKVVDKDDKFLREVDFPEVILSSDFLYNRLRGKLSSYVVEYIIRRSALNNMGGFHKFDLAWNTDDATWIEIGYEKGIKTIGQGYVMWRESEFNISPQNKDKSVVMRKIGANLQYTRWMFTFKNGVFNNLRFKIAMIVFMMAHMAMWRKVLNKKQIKSSFNDFYKIVDNPALHALGYLYYIQKQRCFK